MTLATWKIERKGDRKNPRLQWSKIGVPTSYPPENALPNNCIRSEGDRRETISGLLESQRVLGDRNIEATGKVRQMVDREKAFFLRSTHKLVFTRENCECENNSTHCRRQSGICDRTWIVSDLSGGLHRTTNYYSSLATTAFHWCNMSVFSLNWSAWVWRVGDWCRVDTVPKLFGPTQQVRRPWYGTIYDYTGVHTHAHTHKL